MIYMINSFEFQETNGFYSLKTKYKPKSRKLEKTIPPDSNCLRQIRPVAAVCMEITHHLHIDHNGKVISEA